MKIAPPASFIEKSDSCHGVFNLRSLLQIDGSFKGEISSTNDILISAGAVVESTIAARSVVIAGSFRGAVNATKRVVVLSGAIVEGDIFSPRCEVERGALVNADMVIDLSQESAEETPQEIERKSDAQG